jgi:predicted esterase
MDKDKSLDEDFFPNYELMRFVKAPVFILHGTEDEIIPFNHALALKENIVNNNLGGYKWFNKGKHNDLFNNFNTEFK